MKCAYWQVIQFRLKFALSWQQVNVGRQPGHSGVTFVQVRQPPAVARLAFSSEDATVGGNLPLRRGSGGHEGFRIGQ
jgi:hypothetical protein